ncbi:hypothetical protein WKT22_04880 [Candidatus Lokiarchaeum ossiferum]
MFKFHCKFPFSMISIVETKQKPIEETEQSISKLLQDLHFKPKKTQIFIKPNIVDATDPRNPTITHPKLVEGLILALSKLGGKKFIIGENSGYFSFKQEHFQRLLEETKYERMIKRLQKKYGIDVISENLEFTDFMDIQWKYGTLSIPKYVKTHTYINVPKMKSHLMTGATLSLKNQKGLLLLKDKKQFHLGYGGKTNLHDCITELGVIIKPDFNLVDATTALEGTGPSMHPEGQTKTRTLNLCIGGENMVEVDNACLTIMGISHEEAPHIPPMQVKISERSLPLIPASPPFQKPADFIKYGNIYSKCSSWGCTGCQMAYSRIFRKFSFNSALMEKWVKLQQKYPKIYFYIGKRDINEIEIDPIPKIFFGQCTKKNYGEYKNRLMKENMPDILNNVLFIPGCPADHNDGLEAILKFQ